MGDVDIQRGSPLGNPLRPRGEKERMAVIEGYEEILEGRATAWEVAARHTPPLRVDAAAARVTPGERRAELERLLHRVLMGEALRLRCVCAPRPCHGDVIARKLRRLCYACAEQ